jgi:hypothetical protein
MVSELMLDFAPILHHLDERFVFPANHFGEVVAITLTLTLA